MKQVIVFAGTTEGRQISEWLAAAGVETLCSVATEYGELLVEKQPHLSVRQGRLLPEEMEQLLEAEGKPLVLDVTHPYAVAVSANIKAACEKAGCEYLRLIRPSLMGKNMADKTVMRSQMGNAVTDEKNCLWQNFLKIEQPILRKKRLLWWRVSRRPSTF